MSNRSYVDEYSTIDKEYFIQKPFKIDDLIKRLNTILNCAQSIILLNVQYQKIDVMKSVMKIA